MQLQSVWTHLVANRAEIKQIAELRLLSDHPMWWSWPCHIPSVRQQSISVSESVQAEGKGGYT